MASRSYGITYAGLAIGGASTTYLLTSPIHVEQNYGQLNVTCEVTLRADTVNDFETARTALLAAFRNPYQDLTIVYGSENKLYSQSDNSGFNHFPYIDRKFNEVSGTTLAQYDVGVRLTLPATRAGDNGLKALEVKAVLDVHGKSSMSIDGEYTALAGNGSVAQYKAQIAALEASILAEIDANAMWELSVADFERDKEDKHTVFSRTYRENIEPKVGDTNPDIVATNIAYIKESTTEFEVIRDYTSAMPSKGVKRDEALRVSYTAKIDRSKVINNKIVTVESLIDVWNNDIFPMLRLRILDYAKVNNAGGRISYFVIAPKFTPSEPRISAVIECVAQRDKLLGGEINFTLDATPPWRTVNILADNPAAKVAVVVAATCIVTRSCVVTVRTASRGEARLEALKILPAFPNAVSFGLGANPIVKLPSGFAVPSNDTIGWEITLVERIEGPIKEVISGPKYVGDLLEYPMVLVKIAQSAEYIDSTAALEPQSPRIRTRAREPEVSTPYGEGG